MRQISSELVNIADCMVWYVLLNDFIILNVHVGLELLDMDGATLCLCHDMVL